MALLPVYEWAGIDDDLSRREQWIINVVGLSAVIGAAHAFGWIDLGGISSSVLTSLPDVSLAVVSALVIISSLVIVNTISERSLSDTKWVVAAVVGGFFLIDLIYIHPEVFDNVPSLFYWVVKPFWVGVPMFLAALWFIRNTDLDRRVVYTVSGVIGIVVLQLYYTVIPIPTVSGGPIQVGLVGNLTVGVPVHGAGLLLALAVVVIGITGRRS